MSMGTPFDVATWTVATAPLYQQGVGNITWSGWLSLAPTAEQLALSVRVVGGAAPAVVHLQWSFDGSTNPLDEIVEAPGALAGGEQRYTCNVKAWGPIAVGGAIPILRPVAAPFFRVGVYSDALPAGLASVVVKALAQRGYALQASGS